MLPVQRWPEPSPLHVVSAEDVDGESAEPSDAVGVARPSSPGLLTQSLVTLREANFNHCISSLDKYEMKSIRLFYALAFSGPILDLTCLSVTDLYQGEAQLVVANAPNLIRLELSYSTSEDVKSSIQGAVRTVLANLRHLKYFVLSVKYSKHAPGFSPEALVAPSSGTTPGDLLRPNFACQGLKLFKALSYTFESSDALLPFAHLPELETLVISYCHTKLESLQSVLGSDSPSGAPLKTFPRLENLMIYRYTRPEYDYYAMAYENPREYKDFAPIVALFPALRRCTADIYFAETDSALHKEFPNVNFNFA
ncbi:hypothetical protein EV182_002649, partial [Spiromyces aspiralis]